MKRSFTFLVAIAALVACESGPEIRSQADANVDLGRFATYGFGADADSAPTGYPSFVEQYLRAAVSREMEQRGYQPAASPDLLVYYQLFTKEKLQVTQMPGYGGYGGWRRGYAIAPAYQTDVRQYTEGTLTIDVVERSKNALAWEGAAFGQVKSKSLENPQPAIDAAVAQIFTRYPSRAASSP